jgi:hypothetical protein
VGVTSGVEIAFAVTALVAGSSVVAAIVSRPPRKTLWAAALAVAAVAIAAWVAFALHPRTAVAVSAVGATLAAATVAASLRMRDLRARVERIDRDLDTAVARLQTVVDTETRERTAELERTLARARADSASLLAEQERRFAEERRREAEDREREASRTIAAAVTRAQQQVEGRLRAWNEDLDRAQRTVAEGLQRLSQRQRQLISEAEMRIAADAERLEAETEQQRSGLLRLRDELTRAIQETIAVGNAELETYAAERRRTLHELNDRIRRRERALAEQIEREETEATRRVTAAFADVERRQVEGLQRVLERATAGYPDMAAQQFSDAIKRARDDAGARLSRELDRAVQSFVREAERVLAERLAHVGDAGAQRVDKRLNQVAAGLERHRDEAIAAFEERLAAAEHEMRRRVDAFVADAEAERAVLEARLHELGHRINETIARA